jgi:hypothetical protein
MGDQIITRPLPSVQQFRLGTTAKFWALFSSTVGVFQNSFKTSGRTPWMGDQTITRPLPSVQQFRLGITAKFRALLSSTVAVVWIFLRQAVGLLGWGIRSSQHFCRLKKTQRNKKNFLCLKCDSVPRSQCMETLGNRLPVFYQQVCKCLRLSSNKKIDRNMSDELLRHLTTLVQLQWLHSVE